MAGVRQNYEGSIGKELKLQPISLLKHQEQFHLRQLNKYEPFYERPFSVDLSLYLQNIVNRKNQIGVKYDWYDPKHQSSRFANWRQ
jgi:hypothetical protein